MATTKKTQTPKKTTAKKASSKKTAPKKSSTPAKARPQTWRFYVVTIGIFLVAVATVVVIALFTSSIVAKYTAQARLEKIQDVYASLDLGQAPYIPVESNVFGDKRPLVGDKTKFEASSVEYVYGETVSNTVADLDGRIQEAGFTQVADDSAKNGSAVRYHYKSADDAYILLYVTSKPYLEASQNAVVMNQSAIAALEALDKNAGPSYVVIKVNLDGENE